LLLSCGNRSDRRSAGRSKCVVDVSSGARGATVWALLLAATVVLVAALQWFAPDQTVRPIAERFACEGAVEIRPASSKEVSGVLAQVRCTTGLQVEDVTGLTLFMLGIPCAVALAAVFVVGRRLLAPQEESHFRRAPT
jgi:hypothetical protein